MSEPKRVFAGRPRDRSFEAYVEWIRDFVERLIPGAAQDLTSPDELSKSEASWRAYWVAIDRQALFADEDGAEPAKKPDPPRPVHQTPQDFICPECGGTNLGGRMFVSRDPALKSNDPWSGVLQVVTCADCGRDLPAHLAYRWEMTIEEARAEWRARYRQRAG